MNISLALEERSQNKCEICQADGTHDMVVAPKVGNSDDERVVVCDTCGDQISEKSEMDVNHWRCLNESIWSPVPAVQVLSYRMLKRMPNEGWAQDLLGMMYMDEETTEWAQALEGASGVVHKDSNGNILKNGDTVTLIKDLDVKGANFIAKRGTAVRRISLVADNPEHIQGRVNDQTIIILTKYVKK